MGVEISNRRFKLHGHAPSANFKAEAISVTHLPSGAADEAPYTVLGVTDKCGNVVILRYTREILINE